MMRAFLTVTLASTGFWYSLISGYDLEWVAAWALLTGAVMYNALRDAE